MTRTDGKPKSANGSVKAFLTTLPEGKWVFFDGTLKSLLNLASRYKAGKIHVTTRHPRGVLVIKLPPLPK